MSARQKTCYLSALAVTILAIEFVTALLIVPGFADASIGYASTVPIARTANQPIELAQAKLPAIGGIDDYMHQSGDGPATPPSSPNYYSQPSAPPRGYASQGPPLQEWSNRYNSDPNARRNLLIGAAVVGAVMVGMWAYQQHEQHQARLRARRGYYGRRPYFPE